MLCETQGSRENLKKSEGKVCSGSRRGSWEQKCSVRPADASMKHDFIVEERGECNANSHN